MANSAANKPSDLELQYHGETRTADGYQYWTTSQEDEESLNIREQVAEHGEVITEKKKERKRVFAPGVAQRTTIRIAALILITLLLALGYLVFNYVQVSNAADEIGTQQVDAIIVMGAAQYNGSPSYVLSERLGHALNLYNNKLAPTIITTGAGAEGDVNTEGLVGLEFLLAEGVPESDILLIPEGTNSYEQLSASLFQMEQNDFESVLIVSDKYHSYRLLDIADELGMNAFVSPSAVEPTLSNYMRESAAVAIGRITGYRRLSALTEDG